MENIPSSSIILITALPRVGSICRRFGSIVTKFKLKCSPHSTVPSLVTVKLTARTVDSPGRNVTACDGCKLGKSIPTKVENDS